MLARTKEKNISGSHDPYRLGPMVPSNIIVRNYSKNCILKNSVDLCQEIKELETELDDVYQKYKYAKFAQNSLADLSVDLNNRLKIALSRKSSPVMPAYSSSDGSLESWPDIEEGPPAPIKGRRELIKGNISPPFTPSPRNNSNELPDEYLNWLSEFKGVGGGKKKKTNKRRRNSKRRYSKRRYSKRRDSKRRYSKRRYSKRRDSKRRSSVKRK